MTALLYTIAVTIGAFNFSVLGAGLLVAGIGLLLLRSKGHAVALVLSAIVAVVMNNMLKFLFAIPRLDSALVAVTGYRFPSMHALVASAFFSSLCLSAFCLLHSPYTKVLVAVLSLTAIIVVAWSRVFLHAHLLIDVIIGVLLGVSISLVVHFFILQKCYGGILAL